MTLTKWSHQIGSLWDKTLYERDADGNVKKQAKWNTRIPDEVIKEYFSDDRNRIGDD